MLHRKMPTSIFIPFWLCIASNSLENFPRATPPLPRLPTEAGIFPYLEVFKTSLNGALSNLMQQFTFLPTAEGMELADLQGSFQPRTFNDSMINKLFSYPQSLTINTQSMLKMFSLHMEKFTFCGHVKKNLNIHLKI